MKRIQSKSTLLHLHLFNITIQLIKIETHVTKLKLIKFKPFKIKATSNYITTRDVQANKWDTFISDIFEILLRFVV